MSALSKLIPLTVPLVRSGGQLILMKGARVDEEIEKARKVILRKRLTDVEVLELGDGVVDETTRESSGLQLTDAAAGSGSAGHRTPDVPRGTLTRGRGLR